MFSPRDVHARSYIIKMMYANFCVCHFLAIFDFQTIVVSCTFLSNKFVILSNLYLEDHFMANFIFKANMGMIIDSVIPFETTFLIIL